MYYALLMKTVTVRLPEPLVAEIEAESSARRISKSDVIRQRLELFRGKEASSGKTARIADLIGSVGGLPADLSTKRKSYLRSTGYGRKERSG